MKFRCENIINNNMSVNSSIVFNFFVMEFLKLAWTEVPIHFRKQDTRH